MTDEIVGTIGREADGGYAVYLTFTTTTGRTYHTVRECVGIFDTLNEAVSASIAAERSAA